MIKKIYPKPLKSGTHLSKVIVMNVEHEKIGIWGFGVVGKSMLRFFAGHASALLVHDKRILHADELSLLVGHNAVFIHEPTALLEQCDVVVVSPGVDVRAYKHYAHKFVRELDIFAHNYKKPIIALTGTVGKTTSVHLITQLLQLKNKRVALGGNVGYAMCNLLVDQDKFDVAVLELSSFQLEQPTSFAPDIAIWTNLYANHLDRHGTMQDYFLAKYNIIKQQTHQQTAIVPLSLQAQLYAMQPQASLCFFTSQSFEDRHSLRPQDSVVFINNNQLFMYHQGNVQTLIDVQSFGNATYLENYIITYIVAYLQNIQLTAQDFTIHLQLPEHRMEKFYSFNAIDFYNDSKSTVGEATLAAVDKLKSEQAILILGGMSKGVDRSPFINQLKGKVKTIINFGKEAMLLNELCKSNGVSSYICKDLDEVLATLKTIVQKGDKVLFSPAGSSFDLFKNYEDRGVQFKDKVKQHFK